MGSQYASITYTERLAEAGIDAPIGTVGDSFDNALAETINGLYKTERVKLRKSWRTVDQVELATVEWIGWSNHRRLYQHCGDIPPVEAEAAYYAHQPAQPNQPSPPLSCHTTESPGTPGVDHDGI